MQVVSSDIIYLKLLLQIHISADIQPSSICSNIQYNVLIYNNHTKYTFISSQLKINIKSLKLI